MTVFGDADALAAWWERFDGDESPGDVVVRFSQRGEGMDGAELVIDDEVTLVEEVVSDALEDLPPHQRAAEVGSQLAALDDDAAAVVIVGYLCAASPERQAWIARQALELVANRARISLAGLAMARLRGDGELVDRASAVHDEATRQLVASLESVAPATFGAVFSAAGAADAEG